jgi:hypothetical protein
MNIRRRRPPANYRTVGDPAYGKKFTFSEGETTFLNFSAEEIIRILEVMRNQDVMAAHFPEDGS